MCDEYESRYSSRQAAGLALLFRRSGRCRAYYLLYGKASGAAFAHDKGAGIWERDTTSVGDSLHEPRRWGPVARAFPAVEMMMFLYRLDYVFFTATQLCIRVFCEIGIYVRHVYRSHGRNKT
jgi:hypothetical protein